MRTYGSRVPLGSLLQSCSGTDSGVTGRSACSVIRTSAVYDQGSSHRPITTVAFQEALTFLARRVGGGSTAAPSSPTEEEPGKGEVAAGSDTRNNREEEPLHRQHWEGCEKWLLSSSVEPGKFWKSWKRSPLPYKQSKQFLNV